MNHDPHDLGRLTWCYWRSRYGIGFALFAAIALFFLLSEHRSHTMSALPYLLLATLPLLHVFMHGAHHQGHSTSQDEKGRWGTGGIDDAASTERPRETHR